MRKILLITGIIVVLGLLIGLWAVPALAEGPDDPVPPQVGQETWEKMHQACADGDWEAMAEAAEEAHQGLDYAPCHGDDNQADVAGDQSFPGRWSGMGGHMQGGMMGGYAGDSSPMMRY
ncbi:MAG: hypothetical protein A2Z29_03805 [Chloroflexi bacterium RBG_16_56_11]|nr:MAG: hypothetical protein A2Z29_03805 [Chloroflexi bacterium RBG_16_56_11]